MVNHELERLEAIRDKYYRTLTDLEKELFHVKQHRVGRCTEARDQFGNRTIPARLSEPMDPCPTCGRKGFMDYDRLAGLEKRVKNGREYLRRAGRDCAAALKRYGNQLSFTEQGQVVNND